MILAHFPGELASFTVFCSVLFNRRQEYVKLAPGFVASERTYDDNVSRTSCYY